MSAAMVWGASGGIGRPRVKKSIKVPFKLPPHALQLEHGTERILAAYHERRKGKLGL